MPNRIIKESILVSEKINQLSWFEEALFYRLTVSCDDYGRYDGRPQIIRNYLFPLKDNVTVKNVEAALSGLARCDLVRFYTVDGDPYIFLPGWQKHQRLRNSRAKYPDPPETLCGELPQVAASCGELPQTAASCGLNPNPNPNPNPNIDIKGGKRPSKRKYGEFGHVQLTDEEHEKLKAYPAAEEYIAKVDRWCEQKGKKYKNYYLAILDWMERDGVKATAAASCPGPAPGSLAQEAVRRMMAESKEDDNAETVQGDREGGQH